MYLKLVLRRVHQHRSDCTHHSARHNLHPSGYCSPVISRVHAVSNPSTCFLDRFFLQNKYSVITPYSVLPIACACKPVIPPTVCTEYILYMHHVPYVSFHQPPRLLHRYYAGVDEPTHQDTREWYLGPGSLNTTSPSTYAPAVDPAMIYCTYSSTEYRVQYCISISSGQHSTTPT